MPRRASDPAAARRRRSTSRDAVAERGSLDEWIDVPAADRASLIRDDRPTAIAATLKERDDRAALRRQGRSIYDRLVSHRAAVALLALTRRFIAFLDAEKRKLGVVDFDDLLAAHAGACSTIDACWRARARQFDFIFVDEFQDTDRTQARIIDRLARDASGAFVPGKTIVVGDPKQSIYGFRRADPETYYRMTRGARRAAARSGASSRDQYRSDRAAARRRQRACSRGSFPSRREHDPNVFRPAYHALHAGDATDAARAGRARSRCSHAAARGQIGPLLRRGGGDRGVDPAKREAAEHDLQRFAILFRRLTKHRRLPRHASTATASTYVLPPTRLFLDRRAPVDLLAVLRAIAYPFDRGAQISAARTPYFALTDVEIAAGTVRRSPRSARRGPSASPPRHDRQALRRGLAASHRRRS